MNKISKLSQQEQNAKFYYAAKRIVFESKMIKIFAYLLSIVPIVLSFLKAPGNKTIVFIATMISFSLTLILEFTSSFLSGYKEKSILLNQMYETSITATTFSKIQYDREMTNELNELAIRKSAQKMSKISTYHEPYIPEEIDNKYAYLYMCRLNSASTNYLMSRMYAFYIIALIFVVILFVSFAFVKNDTYEFLQLIIQFYPLVLPIIRNISSSLKTMKYCTKISADIDNFFAQDNISNEELARFVYYTQNIEFEAMLASPVRYTIFYKIHKNGLKILETGVTKRFIDSLLENTKKKPTQKNKENLNNSNKEKTKDNKKTDTKSQIKITKQTAKSKLNKEKQKAKTNVSKKSNKKKWTYKIVHFKKSLTFFVVKKGEEYKNWDIVSNNSEQRILNVKSRFG